MPISTLQSGSFPSNVAIDTDTLVVDGANNRVGINQAAPAHPVHVGTDDLIVDTSGNLLVGKTSIGLSTTGIDLRSTGLLQAIRDGGTVVELNRQTSDGTIIDLRKDNTTVGAIGIQASGFYIDGESGHEGMRFANGAITPRENGSDSDGTSDLGASNNRFKDLYLSGGVYLGGTGSANHLDDYEEGSWTPSDYYGAVSFTVYEAYYTKIGRKVFFELGIAIASNSNGNPVRITGLPFNSVTGNDNTGGAFVVGTNAAKTDLFIITRGQNYINAANNSNQDVYYNTYSNKVLKLNGSYIAA